MIWVDACDAAAIPLRGARVLSWGGVDIALFRTGEGRIYALRDRCPHRGGPLSQGIVHGERVACPLHDWIIDLPSGVAASPDEGCTATYDVRIEAGRVQVRVPEGAAELELDSAPASGLESAPVSGSASGSRSEPDALGERVGPCER